eukprot:m.488829 g.488829  ORF g.488829 m.488829 type:complete len:429 (+) comp26109_c0_seq1:56-1342(+)
MASTTTSKPQIASACTLLLLACLGAPCVALDNGAGRKPPLGWSSWCTAGRCGNDYCSEDIVNQAADALINSGMAEIGYRTIILDDCWEAGSRDGAGGLQWDTQRFPSGMPALAKRLHDRNLSFGLYLSAGNQTCSSGGRPFRIPGSEGHYQQDANSFAAWGIDYVKMDWCGDVHDNIFVGRKDYVAISHAFNNTTPPRTIFVEGVAGYIFLLGDTPHYLNAWRAWTDHHDDWKTTLATITAQQTIGTHGRPGAWPDMDVLTTGGQGCGKNSTDHCPLQTDDEYRTEVALWSINQSPMFVATDIRQMTPVMKETLLNREIAEVHQDTRTPPGTHIGDWPCHGGLFACQMWARPLADGSVMAALLNEGPETHSITLALGRIPQRKWNSNTRVVVRDVWTNTTLGTVTGKFSVSVPTHGTALVRLTATTTA